ncbi:MAG: murein biosynthesis integral membrane protein MurJ [Planctomycetota bacterium]|nr:murein biosynthesis integral membrane protein MurJ [Planctomycetota bacterium]
MNASEESTNASTPEAGGERPSYGSAAWVGLLTLLSRVMGLVREATRAHFLGTGFYADAFQVAFMLPNLLRRLVGEGAISSALVPVYSQFVTQRDRGEQRVFAEKFLTLWLILVLGCALGGVVLGGYFVSAAFRWGSFAEAAKAELTGDLTRLLFIYLMFVGTAAALQGILNAHKYFVLPSTAPLLFNIAFVVSTWAVAPGLPENQRVYALAGAVLVGGLLQLGVMLPLVWRIGLRPRPRWPLDHPGVRRIMRLFVPAVFGAGVYQINALVSTILAGRLAEEGSVAVLSYSNRLMEVVLGVYVVALSTVTLTSLSRQIIADDRAGFTATLTEVLRLVLFITVPSTVGLYLLRTPTLSLLLESGVFDARSLEVTAQVFQFHVIGLSFVGVSRVMVNGFYAMKDLVTPVWIAAVCLVVNLGFAWYLSAGELSYRGIAIAASISAVSQAALLWWALRRRVPELAQHRVWPTLLRSCVATAPMGAAVWAATPFLETADGKLDLAARLALVILGGSALYFLAAALLRMPEYRLLLGRFTRRRG